MAKRLLRGTLRLWGGRAAPCLPPASRCSHSGGEERLETSSAKKLTDIGTRRIFSLEHDIFRESVRKFFQEEVIPYHAEAYSNCTGPGFGLHSDIVMPYITNYGSEEQIKRFIPEMVAGKCIGAIAMTEPGAGSDLQGIRTNAKKDGSDWILNGSKVFVTNGWLCDIVIVVAITNREAHSPAHGISLFLVENGMKGFIKGRKLDKIGLKAQDTAEFFFEDVRLPAGALLGEENKGYYYLMQELPQTVKHKLAELKTSICVTRAFVDSCLQLHRVKRLDVATAAMAKYWASDLQNRVAYDCLQLHGGWGYMFECPIAKAYVDARVQTIYGGTNEIMKELIAREIIHDQ